jgi:hypothetical protein
MYSAIAAASSMAATKAALVSSHVTI